MKSEKFLAEQQHSKEPAVNNRCTSHACWITWETQTRNRSVSKLLDIPLYELISKKSRLLRYVELSVQTIRISKSHDLIFVQNPSIVLAFLAITIKAFSTKAVIVDAHNSGVFPLDGNSRILNYITKLICKRANLVIVTNHDLASIVTSYGGSPFILSDPIPNLTVHKQPTFDLPNNYVFFICTWADDEPYWDVIEAARKLPLDIRILISGSFKRKLSRKDMESLPENVILLGFVEEAHYNYLLANAKASIDLTTRDNCLVCGAYESAAVSTPCIVSDNKINKQVFHTGFVYSKPQAQNISEAILYSLEENDRLKEDIKSFSIIHSETINKKATDLKKVIARHIGGLND